MLGFWDLLNSRRDRVLLEDGGWALDPRKRLQLTEIEAALNLWGYHAPGLRRTITELLLGLDSGVPEPDPDD